MIYFITSNKNKLAEARDILGIEIEQMEIDLPEIQAIEPEKVALEKIKEARKKFSGDFFVEDAALYLGDRKEVGALIKWLPAERIVMAYEGEKAEAVCVVGYCLKGRIGLVTGSVFGKIVKIRGDNGFHWDCIFQPDGYDKTFAEMAREEKNKISHRRKAELKFKDILES
ncbi:MAG: non-canonical purine NTP pyrophosphatase [Patescibacteria group bacterium]|nr:non-canonical purine NTP pyrophosphatase [Patescibacteria group bacterium]